MMDWITLRIELIGIAIFCIWIVVPIREFRAIFKRLRQREMDAGSNGR